MLRNAVSHASAVFFSPVTSHAPVENRVAPYPVTFSSACRLGMVETYSYLPGTNRLVGVYGEGGTDSFQYDAAGNRISGDGKQFEYDPEGRHTDHHQSRNRRIRRDPDRNQ
jgi:hypothetical protein